MGEKVRAFPVCLILVLAALAIAISPSAAFRSLGAPDSPVSSPMTTSDPAYGRLIRQGVVLAANGTGFYAWDPGFPSVRFEGGVYQMWYLACCEIGYATSLDGRNWTKHGSVLSPSLPSEALLVAYPNVVKVGSLYWMFYNGYDGTTHRIHAATSSDGLNWAKWGVVLDVGSPGSADAYGLAYPSAYVDANGFTMWYTGLSSPTAPNAAIMRATSPDGVNWTKDRVVLARGPPGSHDSYQVAAGAVTRVGSVLEMIYTGRGDDGITTRFLYARSTDGIDWQRMGVALEPMQGDEETIFGTTFFPDNAARLWVWYGARGEAAPPQIFLAFGDRTAPITVASVVGTLGNSGWFLSPVGVSLTASDDLSGVARIAYRIAPGEWGPFEDPIILDEGIHTLEYRSVDVSGNEEEVKSIVISIDTTAPVFSVQVTGQAGEDDWYVSSPRLSVNPTDAGSGIVTVSYRVDAGTWNPYSHPVAVSDGEHLVEFQVADVAGHVVSRQVAVRVDTTDPTLGVVALPASITSSVVTISWSATDGGSGVDHFEVRVDDGAFRSVGTNLSYTVNLADGPHRIEIHAFDVAGNMVESEVRFTIDTNVFSMSGPYSGVPTFAIVVAAAAVAGFLMIRWRKRSRARRLPP